MLGVTFATTLVMHLELAVLAGVLLSLLLYLNRTSKPSLRSLVPDAADRRESSSSAAPASPNARS